MKGKISKVILAGLCTVAIAASAMGCSKKPAESEKPQNQQEQQGGDNQGNKETVKLTLWGAAEDQAMYVKQVEAFKAANADKNYEIEVKVVAEGEAREEVLKDVEQAADVFSIPHDQLGLLVESGAVYENTKYVDDVKNNHIDSAITAATYQDKMYGYPTTSETYVLFYDKSKYTEEEVKSLDTMLAKDFPKGFGKFGYEFDSAYYGSAFFFANGGELFTGGDTKKVNYNDANGLKTAEYLTTLKAKGAISIKGDIATSQFKEGTLGAFVAGPWKAPEYKEALGDNYGVAELPTINVGNGDKHLISFAGIRMFCVNATTQFPEEAMALAAFLSTEESQSTRFAERNHLPTIKTLAESEEVNSDETVKAVLTQLGHSYPMPAVPQMSRYWSPMAAFVRDAFDGVIEKGQLQAQLDNLVNDIIAE